MVKFVNYYDKKLPVRISHYALTKYKEETGKDFEDAFATGQLPMEMFEPLLFYSIESGCKALKEEFTFNREEDGFELLEECFFQFTQLIPAFFPEEAAVAKKQEAFGQENRQQRRKAQAIKK